MASSNSFSVSPTSRTNACKCRIMDSRIFLVRASGVRFISSSTACVTCSRFSIIIGLKLQGKEVKEVEEVEEVKERKNRPGQTDGRSLILHFLYILCFLYFPSASSPLFRRGRDSASGFSNYIAIYVLFFNDAEPLRNFPRRLQLVKFGGIYPNFFVCLGVVHGDLHFQSVMIQPPVAFRKVHPIAARTAIDIDPELVVKTNRVDYECVSL